MNARNATTRIAALLAAVAMTTLTLGSQFGLAGHYSAEADAVMAAKRTAPVAQTTATAAPQRKGRCGRESRVRGDEFLFGYDSNWPGPSPVNVS
jgi:hypothetical protein